MANDLVLNVPLLRKRVPNLTVAARSVGLRSATVSDLCTGKIPVGRAEVRTVAALADLAGCSLDELVLRMNPGGMLETGIKVLDLFAPLVRGGTAGLVARPGLGQMVVLAEVLHRMRHQRGFEAILWLPPGPAPYLKDDVLGVVQGVGHTADEVYELVEAARGERDVVVAADRQVVLTGELLELRERLREPGSRPVTFALVDAQGEAPDEEVPYGPLETVWPFDAWLAAQGLYPALNPVQATSVLLESAQTEAAHLSVATAARRLLRRYRELRQLVTVRGPEKIPVEEQTTYARGQRLEMYLTQPFYVAEEYTKKSGVWVSVTQTMADVRRILDGGVDHVDPEELRFRGALG